MSQPLAPDRPFPVAPRFYLTPRQRFTPASLLLALVLAVMCLLAVGYALSHSHHAGSSSSRGGSRGAAAGAGSSGGGTSDAEDDDDPSRVDTIYLGGPNEAPTTARPGAHARAVHPFVVVQLPRSGDQVGQIPDTPAGHLLFDWLAAFNGTDPSALTSALSAAEPVATGPAQWTLRQQTGGFTLMSAKEVQPGVLVFRLHDQMPSTTEVLGTLQVREGSHPASIASFSLRAVSTPQAEPTPPKLKAASDSH